MKFRVSERWCGAAFAALMMMSGLPAVAEPVQLKCGYMVNPLGIDTPLPRLSWQSDSKERDWMQTAYRIYVASRPELAVAGKADVWDSGKQAGELSVDVAYAGPALVARHRYFWSVEVWDKQGRMARAAAPAWWEMGLLAPSDWTAKWIGSADRSRELAAGLRWVWLGDVDGLHAAPAATATFRTTIKLKQKPMRATLAVVARSEFTATVNGRVTGHKKDWAAFDDEDISAYLHAGANEVQIVVTTPALRVPRPDAPAGAAVPTTVAGGFAARVALTAADGSTTHVDAGKQWQGKAGTAQDAASAWVAANDFAEIDDARMGANPTVPAQAARLLRKDFSVASPIVQARLYVTAGGSYRMSIDGRRVGADELTPGFTDYRKHIAYQTYDVTAMVHAGANTLGAMLGDGWYASPMTWAGTRVFPLPVRLLAQLEIQFADGTRQTVGSDAGWSTADSPVLASEIYAGERYDARLEEAGWDAPGFEAAAWPAATTYPAPPGVVSAQIGQAVHTSNTIVPKSVRQLANGDWLFDMGQNLVGWTTLKVAGPSGTTVTQTFAERLMPDGSVYTENLRNADATDSYTLRGGGMETYAPHFTFHGFQYVQVAGFPGTPTTATLTGEVLNSLDTEPTAHLETSSELINRMWQLGIWGQRGNFVSIPTDCPQRDERLGWMGDAGVFWRTGSYNFDIAAFTAKFTQDMDDAQGPTGAFSNISPNLLGPGVGAPGWGDAGVIVPYTAWLQYGDRSLIDQDWTAMERWMDFIEKGNPNFLREKQLGANFADWLAPDQGTPKSLIGTAYWALMAGMMRDMATATGRDPSRYSALFNNIRGAYRKAYVAADGTVEGQTQTGYLVTLYADLAPEGLRAAMTQRLVASVEAHQDHLTTGFLGTPFLLFALSDNGRSDVAYRLLMQETYPSWGYMVAKGATTWWERWNGDSGDPAMNSYNHYSFGSVLAWVYRDTLGIDTDMSGPGFHHLTLHPRFTPALNFARGSYDSVYGKVESDWKRNAAGEIAWTVTIPANTRATVWLEGKARGGHAVEVGSGTYLFVDGKRM